MIKSRVLLKDNNWEDITAYEVKDITKSFKFGLCKLVKSSSKYKAPRLKHPIFLDTETSHNHDEENPIAWVYQWAFKFNKKYYCGRTPKQLVKVLQKMTEYYNLGKDKKAVIVIHNSPYDLSYLMPWFVKYFGTPKILATDPHKYLTVDFEPFIIMDSLRLANRSLDKWSKDLNTLHRKAIGTVDYDIIRYQDTPLSNDVDWAYQFSDCATLEDCWKKERELEHDNVQTLPLTSTGFVRREGRKIFNEDLHNRQVFDKTKLTEETYTDFVNAYWGAISKGNRHYQSDTIHAPIGHRDFRSFYPSVIQCCDTFPVGTPFLLYKSKGNNYKFRLEDYEIYKRKYVMVVTVFLDKLTIKKCATFPIISQHKILFKENDTQIIEDNGRIIQTSGYIVLTCTSLDLDWILRQYDIKGVKFIKVIASEKGYLPEWARLFNKKFFKGKSDKKDLVKYWKGQDNENELVNAEINLMKEKNKLNGIYGCFATRPVRDEYELNLDTGEWHIKEKSLNKTLDKFYNSQNSFMSFQYGCFVTANTRNILLSVIDMVNGVGTEHYKDRVVYCDTDSLFYIKDDYTEQVLNKFNDDNYNERIKNGDYITTDNGKIVEFMTLEDENDDIVTFKFLHSKCYGFYNSKGELSVTIAGVTKYYREDNGLPYDQRRSREDELGTLDNLKEGFVFSHCGGTQSKYFTKPCTIENVNGHITQYASSCIIYNCEKTLSELEDNDIFYESEV